MIESSGKGLITGDMIIPSTTNIHGRHINTVLLLMKDVDTVDLYSGVSKQLISVLTVSIL